MRLFDLLNPWGALRQARLEAEDLDRALARPHGWGVMAFHGGTENFRRIAEIARIKAENADLKREIELSKQCAAHMVIDSALYNPLVMWKR